jgi:homoserine O-acetyltransferase/O-succinyltransferase
MNVNLAYSPELHDDDELVSWHAGPGGGRTIPDYQLAVTTWAEWSEARDNAILITTWYLGTHQICRDIYVLPLSCSHARRRSCA